MNKELEALERIGELKVGCHYEKCAFLVIDFLKDSYDYKIIETALKEYEGAKNHIKALNEERIENSLKLTALEIIKREPSEVIEIITTYDTWEEYIKDYPISDRTIWHIIKNKSEFDLLKEVLK